MRAIQIVKPREIAMLEGVPKPEPADGQVLVEIADRGIGIEPEKLPLIFDEYYRAEEAMRHNSDSSGLGLAIVRHVISRHGIQARVESAPGEGTTFELRFNSSKASRRDEGLKKGEE